MESLIGWIVLPYLFLFGYWVLFVGIGFVFLLCIFGKHIFQVLEDFVATGKSNPQKKFNEAPLWKKVIISYPLALIVFVLHHLYYFGTAFFG